MDPFDEFINQDMFDSDDVDDNDAGSSSTMTGDPDSEAGSDENQHVGQPRQTIPVPGEADHSHNQATNTGPMMHSPVLRNSDSNSGYMPANQPSSASHFPLDSTSTSAANSRDPLHEAPPLASASAPSVSAPTATGSEPNNPTAHITTTSGPSSYTCPFCGGATFRSIHEYIRHCKSRKHGENASTGGDDEDTGGTTGAAERFHCPYPDCEYAKDNGRGKDFARKDNLIRHVKKVHQGVLGVVSIIDMGEL